MSDKNNNEQTERNKEYSATDKERNDTKKHPHGGYVDGLGGMGGTSGAGGVRGTADYVGDISGIDAEIESDEIPMPGTTRDFGPNSGRNGQMNDGGLTGKTRGSASETVPNQESTDSPDNR
jgi:hypothetical protein